MRQGHAAADGLGQARAAPDPDPALAQAVDALLAQLAIANSRAEQAEQRVEAERARVDQLQTELSKSQRELVETRRQIIEILTGDRRPWWRRWFR